MQSCCSPIASASAAAPRARDCLDLLQFLLSSRLASASAAARRLRPLQLLLSIASVSTASRLHPLQLLLPDCIRFKSAPQWHPLRLLLPDCVRFNCCSPIVSVSTASRLRPLRLLGCCSPPAVLEDSSHVHYSRALYAELAVQ